MRRGMALAAVLLLGACGGGEDKQDALTADEDRQLNDAAAMLDEPQDNRETIDAEPADEAASDVDRD